MSGDHAAGHDPARMLTWNQYLFKTDATGPVSLSTVESGNVLRRHPVRLAVREIAFHGRLPVLDRNDLVLVVQVDQLTHDDVQRQHFPAVGQHLRRVFGGCRFVDHATGCGGPVMLEILPFAGDGVDDHRARMVMSRHLDSWGPSRARSSRLAPDRA